jgi:tetratricopeptide (TPR) repeat protein
MALYDEAEKVAPHSCDVLWEGARAYYFVGTCTRPRLPAEERRRLFEEGLRKARAAVEATPGNATAHFWLGVLLMSEAEPRGSFAELRRVPEARREWETALKLDGSVENYGPYRALGRMLFKLPSIVGGDRRRSGELLEVAVRSCPGDGLSKLYLAELLKSGGDSERAFGLVRQVLSMVPDPQWVPEHTIILEGALSLVAKWRIPGASAHLTRTAHDAGGGSAPAGP